MRMSYIHWAVYVPERSVPNYRCQGHCWLIALTTVGYSVTVFLSLENVECFSLILE